MDPSTTLETLRQAIRYDGPMTDADRIELLSMNFQALDDWLSKGGFPPAQWGNLTTREAAHEDAERRIQEIRDTLEPNPWRGPRWAGSLTAAEVLGSKLRGDA